jgi:hypothetical protein
VASIICEALTSGYVVAVAAGRRLLETSEVEGESEGQLELADGASSGWSGVGRALLKSSSRGGSRSGSRSSSSSRSRSSSRSYSSRTPAPSTYTAPTPSSRSTTSSRSGTTTYTSRSTSSR